MKNTKYNLPATYLELLPFRDHDVYLPGMPWETWVQEFFPAQFTDLVQSLSNTTSSFYGLMLNEAGNRFGKDIIDELSRATLHALGKKTARQILAKSPDIESNARGIAKIGIIAIFIASPEYKFEVTTYAAEHVQIVIKGVDRYHRIARSLGIDPYVSSPLAAFMQGINDELGLQYTISMQIQKLDDDSHCLYNLDIVL
jgi:hypothetical protein